MLAPPCRKRVFKCALSRRGDWCTQWLQLIGSLVLSPSKHAEGRGERSGSRKWKQSVPLKAEWFNIWKERVSNLNMTHLLLQKKKCRNKQTWLKKKKLCRTDSVLSSSEAHHPRHSERGGSVRCSCCTSCCHLSCLTSQLNSRFSTYVSLAGRLQAKSVCCSDSKIVSPGL